MTLSRMSRKYSLVRRLTKALLGMDFKKDSNGYVKVSELLAHDIFSSIKATEAEIKSLIEDYKGEKKTFELKTIKKELCVRWVGEVRDEKKALARISKLYKSKSSRKSSRSVTKKRSSSRRKASRKGSRKLSRRKSRKSSRRKGSRKLSRRKSSRRKSRKSSRRR